MEDLSVLNILDSYIKTNLAKPKLYDVFLSHKQSESQDRAKLYKFMLQNNGIHAFYDKDELSDEDWTIEKVVEMVSRSKCLLFFYTESILKNPWCELELLIAIKSKIPIFILNVEPTWPNKHSKILKNKFPIYLQSSIKNNIIYDHRYDFDKLSIEITQKINYAIRNKSKKNKTRRKI